MASKVPQRSHIGSHITRKKGLYRYRRRLLDGHPGEVCLSLSTRNFREAEHRAGLLDQGFHSAWRRAVNDAEANRADIAHLLREELRKSLEGDLQSRFERKPGTPVYAYWWEPGDPLTAAEADLGVIRNARASLARDLAENSPKEMEDHAQHLIREHGLPDSLLAPLTAGLIEAAIRKWDVAERRTLGLEPLVFTADEVAGTPPLPQPQATPAAPAPPTKAAPVPFAAALAGWAADNGHTTKEGEKIKRALYDRVRTIERLGIFLGHKDAARVTKADAVRWKEAMREQSLSVLTIRNDLSEMSAIWKWAIKNDKLAMNPFEGVAPPKPKKRTVARRAFTNEEAVAILTAARGQRGCLRWLPWVCCFTGARLTEVCQSNKEDVAIIDGVRVLRIHDEGEDGEVRSIKNEDSRRNIPLHPALVAEGFLDYVAALPAGSPLFPDAKPDKVFGQRGPEAGRKVGRWLKTALKLTDPKISPSHSWRHWFIGACRGVAMHPEVRSALTGHSAKMDESAQYGAGMGAFIKVLAEALATVPSPLGDH